MSKPKRFRPLLKCCQCKAVVHHGLWKGNRCPVCGSPMGGSFTDHDGLKRGQVEQILRNIGKERKNGEPVSLERIQEITKDIHCSHRRSLKNIWQDGFVSTSRRQ